MKKKYLGFIVGALALSQASSILADDLLITKRDVVAISQEGNYSLSEGEVQEGNYSLLEGEVTEVNKQNDFYEIILGTLMDGARLVVQQGTLIINGEDLSFATPEDLKVGMSLTVVVPKNAPVGLSLPPMYGQQTAIIINSPNNQLEVGYFDEALTNEANTLALNISEETQILKNNGERKIFTADDVKNTDAIVFYTKSTRSIPAQTTPKLVMILAEKETVEEEIVIVLEEETVEEKIVIVAEAAEANTSDHVSVISAEGSYEQVRNIAAHGQYQLTWDHANKTATLTKDNDTLIFKAGDISYTHNNEVVKLSQTIIIEDNTMYVSDEVITLLGLDAK